MSMKRVLSLLLVVSLLAGMIIAGGVPFASAEETHLHCVCGGDLAAEAQSEHGTCKDVEWTEIGSAEDWTALTEDAKAIVTNYKKFQGTTVNICLTDDVTMPAALEIDAGQTVNICLNGHTLTGFYDATSKVTYPLAKVFGGTLNITDCVGEGKVIASGATAVYLYSGAEFNLFGGTVTTALSRFAGRWGLVHAGGEKFVMDGVLHDVGAANVNIYGGTLDASGLTLSLTAKFADIVTTGGAVWCFAPEGKVGVYGGTVKGATISSAALTVGDDVYYARGGAIAVTNDTAKFEMTGGVIEGGNVPNGLGAAVYLANGTENEISGGEIKGGVAAKGGAIYKDNGTLPATFESDPSTKALNFTLSLDGNPTPKPEGIDLSDAQYVKESYILPKDKPRTISVDTTDLGVLEPATKKSATIGTANKKYSEHLTFQPTELDRETKSYAILDVSDLNAKRFYSVVGINQATGKQAGASVIFSLYGAATQDGTYTLLASSGDLRGYETGTIDASIEGYGFLKLVVDMSTDAENNASRGTSWCNVCVYNENVHVAKNFTASDDGTYAGTGGMQKRVALTDKQYVVESRVLPSATAERPVAINSVTLGDIDTNTPASVTIGAKDKTFTNHFTMHPTKPADPLGDAYAILDVSSLNAERLYSVVGFSTGAAKTDKTKGGIVFIVYGAETVDGEYEFIASSGDLYLKESGEIDVDIQGYNYIKLVMDEEGGATTYTSRTASWADVCVYSGERVDKHEALNFTQSTDGTYPGFTGENAVDLSDAQYIVDSKILQKNSAYRKASVDTTALGSQPGDSGYARSVTTIGSNNKTFAEHITMHPTAMEDPVVSYAILDVSSLNADRLYSIVGINGIAKKNDAQGILFAVYGGQTQDGAYDLIASSGDIYGYTTGELDVSIAGYNYIKLELDKTADGTEIQSRTSSWCNITAYNEPAPEEPEEPAVLIPYTSTENGFFDGIWDAEDGKVTYLSNLIYTSVCNTAPTKPTTLDYPYGATLGKDIITIGEQNTKFLKGLGVHPKSTTVDDAYTIYDVSTLGCDRFYSAVGITNQGGSSPVLFTVYGDYGDGVYQMLAQSEQITKKMTGEFHVDIAGVKNLKLCVAVASGAISSRGSAWAGACVYKSGDGVVDPTGFSASRNSTGAFGYTTADATTRIASLNIPGASNVQYLSDLYNTDAKVYSFVTGAGGSEVSVPRNYTLDKNFPTKDGDASGKYFIYNKSQNRSSRLTVAQANENPAGSGYRTVDTAHYMTTGIAIGAMGTIFEKGLGFLPSNPGNTAIYPAQLVYDVRGLNVDHFYGVAGVLGSGNDTNITTVNSTYYVYGSKAESFADEAAMRNNKNWVELAKVENIKHYFAAEFNVDVTGYNYVRLVCVSTGTTNSAGESAWGNACFYKAENKTGGAATQDLAAWTINTSGTYVYTVDTDGDHIGELKIGDAQNLLYLSDLYNTSRKVDSFVTGPTNKELSGKTTFRLDRTFPQYNVKQSDGSYAAGEDRVYPYVSSGSRTAVGSNTYPNGRTAANGFTYMPTDIVVGPVGMKINKGLSFFPTAPAKIEAGTVSPANVVYDLRGLGMDRFYALGAMTDEGNNPRYCKVGDSVYAPRPMTFTVLGSKDSEYAGAQFEVLAEVGGIETFYAAEFNVDVAGYNFLKLVATVANTSVNTGSVWANACVYRLAKSPVAAEVVWNHGTNENQPTSAAVQIKNGANVAATLDLSASNGWKDMVRLPKYVPGTVTVADYTAALATAPEDYEVAVNGMQITCTFIEEDEEPENPGTPENPENPENPDTPEPPAPVEPTELLITGGKISGAEAEAIYLPENVTLRISGTAVLDNTVDIFYDGGKLITSAVTSGDTFSVAMTAPGKFADAADTLGADQFASAAGDLVVVLNGTGLELQSGAVVSIRDASGKIIKTFVNMTQAINASADATGAAYFRLEDDVDETVDAAGLDVVLDLAGHNFAGEITAATFAGIDTTTDSYGEAQGKLSATVNGTLQDHVKAPSLKRYIAVDDGEGNITFNRIYVGINKIALRTTNEGLGYQVALKANQAALDVLTTALNANDGKFGIELWVSSDQVEGKHVRFPLSKDSLTAGTTYLCTVILDGQLQAVSEGKISEDHEVNATVYMDFKNPADTTFEVVSAKYHYSVKHIIELIDVEFNETTNANKQNMVAIYNKYADMMAAWNVPNMRKAAGK